MTGKTWQSKRQAIHTNKTKQFKRSYQTTFSLKCHTQLKQKPFWIGALSPATISKI
jgi:hypothetical protein